MLDATLPNRQSIRMKGWDYTSPGYYFVTCNTHGSRALFGTIVNGRMVLSEAGRVAEDCWQAIPRHFPNVGIDEFVVMPNHLHGLVRLPAHVAALGDVMGAYKAAVSRILGKGRQLPARTWHRNYWDVIVRDERALANIRRYIQDNPRNYDVVMNVAEPQFLGDKALLAMPKMGFLASRGMATPHGQLPLNAGEAILSGFLSPMEQAVFKAGLAHERPMIWVKPWGLEESVHAVPVHQAVEAGRLLVLSPFADTLEAPNLRRAAWCNQYVLAHSDRLVIGHLNPDGMLACVLSEANPAMEIVNL